jgi:hypothetical protein
MILSKTCLLLFGLILCAVLIAVLTQNYNEALCVHVSDLVKIKHGKKIQGGNTEVSAPNVRGYNKEFIRDHNVHNPSFRHIDLGPEMETIRFPPGRVF